MKTYNEVYSALSMRRRYEVWFLRLGLNDGSGAWWFRYLLLNPGRGGCAGASQGRRRDADAEGGEGNSTGRPQNTWAEGAMDGGTAARQFAEAGDAQAQPVQVWATWFPREGKPETWIQGFPLENLHLSKRGASPFFFEVGENRNRGSQSSENRSEQSGGNQSKENRIGESECCGRIEVNGHRIGWDLRYQSTFRMELSSKGWIGFSRTPHSDAIFSGEINLDGRIFRGEPLGYGMQGQNCGYRHRNMWTWAQIHFPGAGGGSTLEALVYEMPFGLVFRKAVLWHKGQKYKFGKLRESIRDAQKLEWKMECSDGRGAQAVVEIRGRPGFVHRLPYTKTDCSGQFEVTNDSLAVAKLFLRLPGESAEELTTDSGAVLEMAGN